MVHSEDGSYDGRLYVFLDGLNDGDLPPNPPLAVGLIIGFIFGTEECGFPSEARH